MGELVASMYQFSCLNQKWFSTRIDSSFWTSFGILVLRGYGTAAFQMTLDESGCVATLLWQTCDFVTLELEIKLITDKIRYLFSWVCKQLPAVQTCVEYIPIHNYLLTEHMEATVSLMTWDRFSCHPLNYFEEASFLLLLIVLLDFPLWNVELSGRYFQQATSPTITTTSSRAQPPAQPPPTQHPPSQHWSPPDSGKAYYTWGTRRLVVCHYLEYLLQSLQGNSVKKCLTYT